MNGIDILIAIGETDDELLIECDSYNTKKYRPFLYIAACIAVCALSAAAVNIMNKNDISHITVPEPITSSITTNESAVSDLTVTTVPESVTSITVDTEITESSATTETISETQKTETDIISSETTTENMTTPSTHVTEDAIIPYWNELSESEKYPYFMYNNTEYHMTNTYYSSDEVEFLFNDCIYGIDEYTSERHEKQVSVYTIKNTDESYAVAIRIDDKHYRKYSNSGYAPQTLGEYLNGTNLLNRYDIGHVQIKTGELFDSQTEQVYYTEYIMEDTSELISSLFNENINAPQETNYSMVDLYFYDDGKQIFSIRGGNYISFGGNCYCIGEEAVQRFIEEIKASSEEKTVYLNLSPDSTDIPE